MGSGLLTPGHLMVLAVIALLVFGPKRLPELGRSLGAGMRGFKSAIEGDEEDDRPAALAESSSVEAAGSVGSPGGPSATRPGGESAAAGVK